MLVRSLFGMVCVGLVAAGSLKFEPSIRAHISQCDIDVDGLTREYRLVIPEALDGKQKVPVVFALHGALDTTEEMAKYTKLDRSACEHGFLLVYLQGRHLNWPHSIPADNPDYIIPDLRFFESMCDLVVEKHAADANRIYVVGVSQGGAMANVLTAKCSHRIAATVCNCGWLPAPLGATAITTSNKCPILFVSGTADQQVRPETVRAAHDAFERAGHPVTFQALNGKAHGWNDVNDLMWSFLRNQIRPHLRGIERGLPSSSQIWLHRKRRFDSVNASGAYDIQASGANASFSNPSVVLEASVSCLHAHVRA